MTINHLAFIMDGNRRWAVEQGMNKIDGHQHGSDTIHAILAHCLDQGIKHVSVYALSTENWNRSSIEVAALLKLLKRFVTVERDRLLQHKVAVQFIGDLSRFDQEMQDDMHDLETITQEYVERGTLYVCLSYGGRSELVNAAEQIAQRDEEYSEENFEKYLWSHDMPDVDLMIRTGGNHRLSNFLLWRCAYAELYFTDTYWPGFTAEELDSILQNYYHRIQVNKGK